MTQTVSADNKVVADSSFLEPTVQPVWTVGGALTTDILQDIRNGKGYLGAFNGATVTNTNVAVGLSLFNPAASAKTLLVYSMRLGMQSSALSGLVESATVDPALPNVVTPVNTLLGGAASVASVTSSPTPASTSISPVATVIDSIGLTGEAAIEYLTNGGGIALPPGNGLLIRTTVATAGNVWFASFRWLEY